MTNVMKTDLRERVGQQFSFLAPAVILLLAVADLLPGSEPEPKKIPATSANAFIIMDDGREIPFEQVAFVEEKQDADETWRLVEKNQISLTSLSFGIPDDVLNPPRRTALVNTPFATAELEDLVVYYFGIKLNMRPFTQFQVERSETYLLDVREVLPDGGAARFIGSIDLARQAVGYVTDGNPDNLRWEGFDPGYTPAESYQLGGVGPAVRPVVREQMFYQQYQQEYTNRLVFGLCGPSRITYSAGAGPDPRCDCPSCRSAQNDPLIEG